MTTVAYRGGILAADRRCTVGGWKAQHSVSKVFFINGKPTAVTGDLTSALRLVDWMKSSSPNNDRPSLGDNARVIVLNGMDKLTIYEGDWHYDICAEYAAWGSGMPAATAAMIMGANAIRAVEVAAMLDDCTGVGVDALTVLAEAK